MRRPETSSSRSQLSPAAGSPASAADDNDDEDDGEPERAGASSIHYDSALFAAAAEEHYSSPQPLPTLSNHPAPLLVQAQPPRLPAREAGEDKPPGAFHSRRESQFASPRDLCSSAPNGTSGTSTGRLTRTQDTTIAPPPPAPSNAHASSSSPLTTLLPSKRLPPSSPTHHRTASCSSSHAASVARADTSSARSLAAHRIIPAFAPTSLYPAGHAESPDLRHPSFERTHSPSTAHTITPPSSPPPPLRSPSSSSSAFFDALGSALSVPLPLNALRQRKRSGHHSSFHKTSALSAAAAHQSIEERIPLPYDGAHPHQPESWRASSLAAPGQLPLYDTTSQLPLLPLPRPLSASSLASTASSSSSSSNLAPSASLYTRSPSLSSSISSMVAPYAPRRASLPHAPAPPTTAPQRRKRLYGLISLALLALQNTSLAIVLHASRLAPRDSHGGGGGGTNYFTPAAVLLTEILKATISAIFLLHGIADRKAKAVANARARGAQPPAYVDGAYTPSSFSRSSLAFLHPSNLRDLMSMTFSSTAWSLSLPAFLYVLQNNLQYTAAENLEPAIFQTLYQLKILTTALCSRILLGTRLGPRQWTALVVLACGVAIVQVGSQAGSMTGPPPPTPPGAGGPPDFSAPFRHDRPPIAGVGEDPSYGPSHDRPFSPHAGHGHGHGIGHHFFAQRPGPSPMLGFLAVLAACMTSGLAGVWFEKVLKHSKTSSPRVVVPAPDSTAPADATSRSYGQAYTHVSDDKRRATSPAQSLASSSSSGSSAPASIHASPVLQASLPMQVNAPPQSHSAPLQSTYSPPSAADSDVWLRNLQLSLFSLPPALIPVMVKIWTCNGDIGAPFKHFGAWAWMIVWLQTLGGLVTALVMRWADNILKCFAVALALLLTSVLSIPLFDFQVTPSFLLGAGLTLVATVMYQRSAAASLARAGAADSSPSTSPVAGSARKSSVSEDEEGSFLRSGDGRQGPRRGSIPWGMGLLRTQHAWQGKQEEHQQQQFPLLPRADPDVGVKENGLDDSSKLYDEEEMLSGPQGYLRSGPHARTTT